MNKILEKIINDNEVETVDGKKMVLDYHIPTGEGLYLQDLINSSKPVNSLEVGMAYGISTLFICESLMQVQAKNHIVIDPYQSTFWKGIGTKNVKEAGYQNLVRFIEEPSELALPKLLQNNTRLDFAFIDGLHTFDQALLDFYFINRMLDINGIVVFDDADWPGISKVCGYVSRYPCYKICSVWPAKIKPLPLWFKLAKSIYYKATNQGQYLKNDLTISRHRCVAFQKTSEDIRDLFWFKQF
jgi:predicted O-methyltransferase YrrM